jgi:hypothetical protein
MISPVPDDNDVMFSQMLLFYLNKSKKKKSQSTPYRPAQKRIQILMVIKKTTDK